MAEIGYPDAFIELDFTQMASISVSRKHCYCEPLPVKSIASYSRLDFCKQYMRLNAPC